MKINRENITEHLVEYQLNMIGKSIQEVKDDELWFSNNTITSQQEEEFKKYALPLLQKVFKFNKKKAISTLNWFLLAYGLRVKDNE